jgi:hypothetical protein
MKILRASLRKSDNGTIRGALDLAGGDVVLLFTLIPGDEPGEYVGGEIHPDETVDAMARRLAGRVGG